MTTPAALVAAAPAAGAGYPMQRVDGDGLWRVAVEVADLGVGSGVVWHDLTARVAGWQNVRGADQYAGRYRASVVDLDLFAPDDRLAPWTADTTPVFGTNVNIGTGLLLRAGMIRVLDGVVAEWLPRFTNRVERWGDASYAEGRVRRHPLIARDLLTALVSAPVPASSEENWSERVAFILTQAGWPFGYVIYGATFDTGVDVLTVPARPASVSALAELQATLDPAGLVYYTDRRGVLIIRPAVWDTFHTDAFTAGADGTPLGDVSPVSFTYYADTIPGQSAYATGVEDPFGFDESEDAVINHVVVTSPAPTFDDDDPVSITRHDRHKLETAWIAGNNQAAADLLTYRANAVVEARPLFTTLELAGFGEASRVDYLGYVAIDHQTAPGRAPVFGNGWVRNYTERVAPLQPDNDVSAWDLSLVVDIYTVAEGDLLLAPEDLLLVDVTDVLATFTWTNPTQPITPTHTQIRMLNPASLWATVDYPLSGVDWGGLEPNTAYQFQVRYLRVVDELVTHVSPTAAWAFRTDPTTRPDVDHPGGDGDPSVDFPPPGAGCTLEWKLDESANGTTWSTVDTGTVTAAPWEIPALEYAWNGARLYRVCSRELCPAPGAYVCSDLFTGECSDPPALLGAPFTDDYLRFYLPAICPPDQIVEAISEAPATRGYQFSTFVVDGDGNVVIVSRGEGIVAYGDNPHMAFTPGLNGLTGDATAACKVLVTHQPDATVVLFSAAGVRLHAVANGANWSVNGQIVNAGGGVTNLAGTTLLDFGAWYDVALTHDTAGGDVILYVDGGEEDSAAGLDNARHNPGGYGLGVPEASLITNCAVWARVLADTELPGYVAPPPPLTVTINQAAGQADPATVSPILFTVVFSEAVTGFATGDVTLSAGTAPGTLVGTVTGSGTTYTVSVAGMTGSGTVIATIAAAVCTATATSVANDASTSTDNTVTYNAFTPITGVGWAHAFYVAGPEFVALGVANGAAVTNLPDEIGTANLVAVSTGPTYRSASAFMNGKPTLQFTGIVADRMVAVWGSDTAQPYSFVVIGRRQHATAQLCWLDGNNSGKRHAIYSVSTNWSIYNGTTLVQAGTHDQNIHMLTAKFRSGANDLLQVDGTNAVGPADAGTNSTGGMTLGTLANGSSFPFLGYISFIGMYAGDVTADAGWAAFKAWVNTTYGITVV